MSHPLLVQALVVLTDKGLAIPASVWSSKVLGAKEPGLYSWWADKTGARELSDGLGHRVRPGLIYAGQTGATRQPSGKPVKTVLRTRVGRQHIRGDIYGSTFRLTLGASLCLALGLEVVGPKKLSDESEQTLRAWIEEHLSVVVFPMSDRGTLGNLEDDVVKKLDPPLNLGGCGPTPLRTKLTELRGQVTAGEQCGT